MVVVNRDMEVVWAKSAKSYLGLGHVFADKLKFAHSSGADCTADHPTKQWCVHCHLLLSCCCVRDQGESQPKKWIPKIEIKVNDIWLQDSQGCHGPNGAETLPHSLSCNTATLLPPDTRVLSG